MPQESNGGTEGERTPSENTQLQNNGIYVCNTSSVVCINKYLRSMTVKMNIGKDLIHFDGFIFHF